jgi:hypothetical protein
MTLPPPAAGFLIAANTDAREIYTAPKKAGNKGGEV